MSIGQFALLFPGQGSQYVGMGKMMATRFPRVAEVFAAADNSLGEPLSQLCFFGPEDKLRQTENTQPAILTTSVALYRLVAEHLPAPPAAVAGHSLGEYAALVAAGVLDLADAVRVVRQRGRFMEQAVPGGAGTMAAVLGLPTDAVRQICADAGGPGLVEPATLNGGGQVVIAGMVPAVEEAAKLARERGAKAVHMLNVSGPFHTSLLRPAGERLREVLADVEFRPAHVPVYCNTLAAPVTEPGVLREALVDQVSQAVRWEETILAMWDSGVRTFVEVGPGRVLSGLVRRIVRTAQTLNVDDSESWEKFLVWAKGDVVL